MMRLADRGMARRPLALIGAAALLSITVDGAGAQRPGQGRPTPTVVRLERRTDVPCEMPGPGWGNLFFEADAASGGRVAPFGDVAPGRRVEVIERRGGDGVLTYGVRVAGDESGERTLGFAPFAIRGSSDGRCATAEVPLDGQAATVRLQVAFADKYVYGRIAEYRVGHVRTARGRARVEVRPVHRGALQFHDLTALDLFVSTDEQAVRRETVLDSAGTLRFGDRVTGAFALGVHEGYTIDSVTTGGTRLYLTRVGSRVPVPARGFRAPAFAGTGLDGRPYRLAGRPGRLTVIEFWSTECPFSERARPAANQLADAVLARGGAYVMAVRESDTAAVRAHLAAQPRRGTVIARDSATWHVWNPMPVTPLYYVIGADGTILLREHGAAAVRLAAATAGVRLDESSTPRTPPARSGAQP